MINVACEVPIYEQDGKEKPVGTNPKLGVASHWNRNEMVVLKFGEHTVTVLGRDLQAAITNAQNISR